MANELQSPDSASGAPMARDGKRLDSSASQGDPTTWYGLVWRIVQTAVESNAKTIRVSVLLVLACAILLVVAHFGR